MPKTVHVIPVDPTQTAEYWAVIESDEDDD